MKKILSFIIIAVLCLGVLSSCTVVDTIKGWLTPEHTHEFVDGKCECGEVEKTPVVEYNLENAANYLKALYKDDNPVTAADYEVVGQVRIAAVPYDVDWSVDNELVKLTDNGATWLVDVDEEAASEHNYKLTATIKAGDGTSTTVTFDRTVPEKNLFVSVANPEEGVAYKLFMIQVSEGQTLYATGVVGGKYLNTTQVGTEAPDFFVEKSGEGFKFYFMDGDKKMYVEAYLTLAEDGHYSKCLKYSENGTVWTWHAETKSWWSPVLSETGLQYVIGTYGSFTTFSISETSYISADNTGKSQFPAGLVPKAIAEIDKSTPEERVDTEIENIELPLSVKVDSVVDLPVAGVRYTDVVISWESNKDCAVVDGSKLTVTLPAEETTVTLTATLTLGEVTKTKEFSLTVAAKPADGKVSLNRENVFAGITEGGYGDHNGDHTVGDLTVSTNNVMGNTYGDNVLQFKKETGTLTVKNVTVSSVTLVIVNSYDYSANVEVKIGDTVLELPAPADVNAAGVDSGIQNSSGYAIKRYTVTIELDAPLTGDLVVTNTTGYAVYMESINIK